jgi:hypothetical protein
VPYRGPVEGTVSKLMGGVRSAKTYVGAVRLKEVPKRTTFIMVGGQLNTVFGGDGQAQRSLVRGFAPEPLRMLGISAVRHGLRRLASKLSCRDAARVTALRYTCETQWQRYSLKTYGDSAH